MQTFLRESINETKLDILDECKGGFKLKKPFRGGYGYFWNKESALTNEIIHIHSIKLHV